MAERTERLRLLLIGSTVVAAVITLVLGVPRARQFLTPRIDRVWVVSAALGDSVASIEPREVLEGTPVTLLAIIEARPAFGGENRFYGTVDQVVVDPAAGPVPVETWNDWWYPLEFLWLKVEPLHGYANPEFETDFDLEQVVFNDAFQVAWGFAPTHAADVTPAGDIFPDLESGTMRFAARAVVRDWRDRILQQVQSPSADQVHDPDLRLRPHRITVRSGDDAFGRLTAYAGLAYVPYLDPEGHPADDFIGGTVLDFWLRAQRAAGVYSGPMVQWDRLEEVADVVVDDMFLANDGAYYWTSDPLRSVDWGTVLPGDIVTIDDHVGIVFEDRGPGGGGDGILNRWDEAWGAYFEPLRTTPLGEAFVSDIRVWRLRDAAQQ